MHWLVIVISIQAIVGVELRGTFPPSAVFVCQSVLRTAVNEGITGVEQRRTLPPSARVMSNADNDDVAVAIQRSLEDDVAVAGLRA